VRQFEDLAKSAVEVPQKIWLRRTAVTMPASAKKSNPRGSNSEVDGMPNTRQTESARKEREASAAATAPALPPRAQPVVPMPGTAPKPAQQKRKGDDNLKEAQPKRKEVGRTNSRDETVDLELVSTPPNIMGESRDESYKSIMEELAHIGNTYPELKNKIAELMKRVNKVLNESIKMTKDETKAEMLQELENRKCSDSLVLYNVQNMVYPRNSFYDKVRPEEAIMNALKTMTRHLATILSVTTLARTEKGFPMTVKVVLSDPMQKGTLFRSLAHAKTEMPDLYEMFRGVAFRDCFPQIHREEVKKMVAEGMEMKNAGEVAAFRVVARGHTCSPVLQKKMKNSVKWQEHNRRQDRVRPENWHEAMVVDEDVSKDDRLILKMPYSFKKHAYKDPTFQAMRKRVNTLVKAGKGFEADIEWKGEISDMEEAMEAFKQTPEVKKKMAEILIDFTQAYDLWAQEFGYDEGEYE
jgi:alkylhydroperoxidase/carboxymuconolactone decarboxylase family protein YurZ